MDRVSELTTTAKAMLLDGLQRMKLTAHPMAETFVKNVIMKTKYDDLSELKSMTDSKGDINSMHKLIYQDIRSRKTKEDILKHIADQARVQAAHNLMKTKVSSTGMTVAVCVCELACIMYRHTLCIIDLQAAE